MIEETEAYSYIGVILDTKITWKELIKHHLEKAPWQKASGECQ